MSKVKYLLIPLALLFTTAFVSCDPSPPDDGAARVIFDDVWFDVEVPRVQHLWEQGLTGRPYLEAGKGMLYIADGPDVGSLWMKDMRFPLDFVWIGRNCRVVDIHPYVSAPLPNTPDNRIPSYRSYATAAYALEINAGDTDRYKIRVGDKVEFNNIRAHC